MGETGLRRGRVPGRASACRTPAGEQGPPGLHRLWARPTADINGIWGGYQGHGAKTVIAAEAGAKVSFRLVTGPGPAIARRRFQRFVAEPRPKDAQIDIAAHCQAPGFEVRGR